jgi:hypothetical protein
LPFHGFVFSFFVIKVKTARILSIIMYVKVYISGLGEKQ